MWVTLLSHFNVHNVIFVFFWEECCTSAFFVSCSKDVRSGQKLEGAALQPLVIWSRWRACPGSWQVSMSVVVARNDRVAVGAVSGRTHPTPSRQLAYRATAVAETVGSASSQRRRRSPVTTAEPGDVPRRRTADEKLTTTTAAVKQLPTLGTAARKRRLTTSSAASFYQHQSLTASQ